MLLQLDRIEPAERAASGIVGVDHHCYGRDGYRILTDSVTIVPHEVPLLAQLRATTVVTFEKHGLR